MRASIPDAREAPVAPLAFKQAEAAFIPSSVALPVVTTGAVVGFAEAFAVGDALAAGEGLAEDCGEALGAALLVGGLQAHKLKMPRRRESV